MIGTRSRSEKPFDPEPIRQRLGEAIQDLVNRYRTELEDPRFLKALPDVSATPIAAFHDAGCSFVLCRIPVNPKADLTARETQVVVGLRDGQPNKAIARNLGVSIRTVETHLEHVYLKVGIKSRVELALVASRFAGSKSAALTET